MTCDVMRVRLIRPASTRSSTRTHGSKPAYRPSKNPLRPVPTAAMKGLWGGDVEAMLTATIRGPWTSPPQISPDI